MRYDARSVRTLWDLHRVWRDIDEQPVREVNAGEVGWNLPVLLIDIDRGTRAIGVDTRDHERTGVNRRI
jgi:hypothetical protein